LLVTTGIFLNRVCNGILAFEGNGHVYFSEGNYDYYVEKRKKALKEKEKLSSIEQKKGDTRIKEKTRKLTWAEQKELEIIEENILNAEAKVEEIENLFSLPDFFEKYADKTKELNSQLEEAKIKVANLYNRWEELEEIKGQLKSK
jgi:ATP-binding cassette subfamily F protein uup